MVWCLLRIWSMGLRYELLANFPVLEAQALHAHTVLQIPAGIRGFFVEKKRGKRIYGAHTCEQQTWEACNSLPPPITPQFVLFIMFFYMAQFFSRMPIKLYN